MSMGRHEAENEARLARWVFLRRAHKDLFSNRLRTKTKRRLVQEPKAEDEPASGPCREACLGCGAAAKSQEPCCCLPVLGVNTRMGKRTPRAQTPVWWEVGAGRGAPGPRLPRTRQSRELPGPRVRPDFSPQRQRPCY